MNNILITGGTGSFGKAFIKKLIKEDDKKYDNIVVYSRDEHKQEQMAAELKSDRLRFFLGDIRDRDRLKLAVQDCMYIVHTAALKVVPAGEYNPMEFIKTNILGAQNLVDVLVSERERRYTKVIALSTDKAVNPLNLYGATKLCMEKLLLAANNLVGTRDIKFSVVRYGNVANSNGSVIPKFRINYIADAPLEVTDTRMTRYWITLDEATEFVANKLVNMKGGEVFIPDMPSFKIIDLASAFDKYGNRNIKEIGIRPGEKLHEQIDENRFSNTNNRFLTWQELREQLKQLGVIS